jgi:hypothetical protein
MTTGDLLDTNLLIGALDAEPGNVQALGDASQPKLDKRSFDLFHCVAAHHNKLEVASRDGDIPKIMEVLKQVSA